MRLNRIWRRIGHEPEAIAAVYSLTVWTDPLRPFGAPLGEENGHLPLGTILLSAKQCRGPAP